MEFKIFDKKLGKDSLRYLNGDWGLYIEPFKPKLTSQKFVVSTSLFIFPERVKNGPLQFEEYKQRVKVYIGGILKSAEYIKTLQGIVLRVYLDYSAAVARDAPDQDLNSLGELVFDSMKNLVKTFPDTELVGVRYPPTDAQSTFLPSLWRFLPLFDENVSAMVCTDADIPFNSLYLELMKPWLTRRDTTYCFILPESYSPAWCSIWAALHKVLSGNVLCPLASLWGAVKKRNTRGGSIEHPKVFCDMLALATREDLAFVAANAPLFDGIESEVIQDIFPDKLPRGLIKNPRSMLEFFEKKILDKMKHRKQSASMDKLLSILAEKPDVLHLLTIFTFNTYFARELSMFRRLTRTTMKDVVLPVVSGLGYGIDELVLQIPLAKRLPAKDVTLVASSNANSGLSFVTQFSFTTMKNLDPYFSILQNILPKQDDQSFVVEAMLRSILFLYQICPHKTSVKEVIDAFTVIKRDYYRRLYECAEDEFKMMFSQFPKFVRFLDRYYLDADFCDTSLKKFIKMDEPSRFHAFLKDLGIAVVSDQNKMRPLIYPSMKSFSAVKDMFFRGFFVNIPTLHLFKTVSNLKAQIIPW